MKRSAAPRRSERAAGAFALELQVAERGPAGQRGINAVVTQRGLENPLNTRALGAGEGREIHGDLAAEPAKAQLARQFAGRGEIDRRC